MGKSSHAIRYDRYEIRYGTTSTVFDGFKLSEKRKTYHEDSVQETAEYPVKLKALSSKPKVATWCKIIQVCQEYYEMATWYAINAFCRKLTILDKI